MERLDQSSTKEAVFPSDPWGEGGPGDGYSVEVDVFMKAPPTKRRMKKGAVAMSEEAGGATTD